MTFTIVIPTYNRKQLVLRAIASAYATQWPDLDVIVVDDASTDDTGPAIAREFPAVRYFRLKQNSGPCAARNLGIQNAATNWSVLLDDDDELRPDGLSIVARAVDVWPQAMDYPCMQFARTNGFLAESFMIVKLPDYLHMRIRGDFVPVLNLREFVRAGLSYPDQRAGGEGLLWFTIARAYGIPSWTHLVANLGDDAPVRLCSTANQLARPRDYAKIAESLLTFFGDDMLTIAPKRYLKCAIGAAAYRLLAGDKRLANLNARKLPIGPRIATVGFIMGASLLPRSVLRHSFQRYRAWAGDGSR